MGKRNAIAFVKVILVHAHGFRFSHLDRRQQQEATCPTDDPDHSLASLDRAD
jgi:hypothetical protein